MRVFLSEKVIESLLVLKEALSSFRRENNFQKAAAFAYYGFFALIPLLLLAVYILGHYILSSQAALKAVGEFTSQMFPDAVKIIIQEVSSLSRHKKMWGTITTITLFWSITPLAGALRNAFRRTFNAERNVPFLKEKLLDAAAVLVILVLFIALVLSELFYSMVISKIFSTHNLLSLATVSASFILTMLLMTVFYYAFLPFKVKTAHLLAGAYTTAILWAIMKPVFSLFMKFNPTYGFTFGSLKAIFILFMWVYYSFAVILFGGEVIAAARKRDELVPRSRHPENV